MAEKAKRGTKRLCGGCGAKFYDLNKEPAICPMCETVFEIKKPEPKTKREPVKEERKKPVVTEEDEVILEGEDDLIDIDDDDDDDLPSVGDDDTFLEVDDEESENTVSSILPASGVSKDDES